MYKFSVITPVHLWNKERIEKFKRCIDSIKNQTFKNFEWVVIDDGSTQNFDWSLIFSPDNSTNFLRLQHGERVIAYNNAFEVAKGDWFCLLDSDDEYKPNALERMNEMIKKYPLSKMFNFGCIYYHSDGTFSFRDPFTPKRKSTGHEMFGGGNIVNGTFIWNRKVYEDLGGFGKNYNGDGLIEDVDCTPINYGGIRDLYLGTPYDFSAWAQIEFPEIRKYFMVDHVAEPNKIIKELGNPWGQDFYLFYKYTRKYHSRAVKEFLYIVNPR